MNIERIDQIIKENIRFSDKIVIWGYGKLGKAFVVQTSLHIAGIYDSCAEEQEEVLPISELERQNDERVVVIITTYQDREVSRQLTKRNMKRWISLPFVIASIEFEEHLRHPHIKNCMIETSSICNARCEFCVNPSLKRKKGIMSDQVFDRIIWRLKEAKQEPEVFRLHLCGEPLLDPGIFWKIRRLKEQFPNSKTGYTTNFELATPRMISEIFDCEQDFIVISVNAVEKAEYEKIMGLNWDRLCENLNLLIEQRDKRESDLDIEVSIVKTQDNQNVIEEFYSKWTDRGVKVRFLKQGKWLQEKGETLFSKSDGYRNKVFNRPLCQQLYQDICVFSDGAYAMCCFDSEGIYDMGNVMDTSIRNVLQSEMRRKIKETFLDGSCGLDICKDCSFVDSQ